MSERAKNGQEKQIVKRGAHSKRTIEITIQPAKTAGEIDAQQLLQEINQAPKLFRPPKRHKHR